MVGEAGFEPAASYSQSRCAAELRYSPVLTDRSRRRGQDKAVSERDADATRRFHSGTKLDEAASGAAPFGYPAGFRPMDPENRPTPFKRYPSAPRLALPPEVGESRAPAVDVLAGRATAAPIPFDAALLGRFLFYSAGVTRVRTDAEGTVGFFRAAPAAGNLHPIEIYAVCGELDGVPAGIHHFAPGEFALETIRKDDRRPAIAAAVGERGILSAPVSLVLTGVPWRTAWKYGARGLRHVYWDAGSLLAQLLAVAEAAGVSARVHLGFMDTAISDELGLDGVTEFPVAVVALGNGGGEVSSQPDPGADFVGGEPERISDRPFQFPVVTETQQAGNLGDPTAVQEWRQAAASLGRPVPDRIDGWPHPDEPSGPLEGSSRGASTRAVGVGGPPPHRDEPSGEEPMNIEFLIRRRGSTRLFKREPIGADTARWCLSVASRPMPSDFCMPGSTLLSHHVSVHAVEGVPSGRHFWNGRDFDLGTSEDAGAARADAQRLCLMQPLGGDSALTVFHSAGLAAVLATLGDRGYRAAQLEAGLAAGRLQLAAFSAGMGGTGLTFFDDAVSAAFSTPDDCLLVTAAGPADYRNRTGGLPGRPAELSGFAPLMRRFQDRFDQDRR